MNEEEEEEHMTDECWFNKPSFIVYESFEAYIVQITKRFVYVITQSASRASSTHTHTRADIDDLKKEEDKTNITTDATCFWSL